ncbi:MAG: hypothetical protein GX281_04645 [Bacteroidales bacterium]|jgi:hypothetical protein|nr:hypothetical protein [Bacteroidales bacterium]NLK79987.1 hypothetical protein [Bacteroidales bacterium]HKM31097.1 hypothetical protein [Bacteroidales bacterium]
MMWIKLGILIIGFIYAGLIPLTLRRVIRKVSFNLREETLSFLSNKALYDKRLVKGYTRLLFITALLHYAFFWLLSHYYDLGQNEVYMQYMLYSFVLLTLLAFVPHNMKPYSFKSLSSSMQRLLHNLLAFVVFLTLPVLIVIFLTAINSTLPFLGITGFVIIGCTAFFTLFSLIRHGLTGACEMIFITGVSLWTIFVTIFTVLHTG